MISNERREMEKRVREEALMNAHGRVSTALGMKRMTKERHDEIVAVIKSGTRKAHIVAWDMLRQDGFGEGVNGSGEES